MDFNIEEFNDIIGFVGLYKINKDGVIISLKYGKVKILKRSVCKANGYFKINLYINLKRKTYFTHKLVAINFLNHTPCGYNLVVNHKNFIRTDNRVENLEIVTQRENANQKHLKNSSKYIGVSWCKFTNKWSCNIHINGKLKHLGRFNNEYEAFLAYQKELQKIKHL